MLGRSAAIVTLELWSCQSHIQRGRGCEQADCRSYTVHMSPTGATQLDLTSNISPFFKSYLCFFSAAAWFSPSISLISSSQPFPVMSSIQQMFFYPRTQGDVCLDVDVCFSVIRWGVLLFSSSAAQFWLGTFGLIFLLRDESFAIFLYASGLLTVKTRWLPSCQIQQLHQWP